MRELALKGGRSVQIIFLETATTNWVGDVNALAKQLGRGSAADLDREGLLRCVNHNRFLAVMEGREEFDEYSGTIVGMAILVTISVPSGQRGVIMDFALQTPEYVGQGIENAMVSRLVVEACELRLDSLSYDGNRVPAGIDAAFKAEGFGRLATPKFLRTL